VAEFVSLVDVSSGERFDVQDPVEFSESYEHPENLVAVDEGGGV